MFKNLFLFWALALSLAFISAQAQPPNTRLQRLRDSEKAIREIISNRREKRANINTQYESNGKVDLDGIAYLMSAPRNTVLLLDPSLDTTKQYSFNIHNTNAWQELQKLADENELVATQVPGIGYTLGKKGWNAQEAIEKEQTRKIEQQEARRQWEKKRKAAQEMKKNAVKNEDNKTTPTVQSRQGNDRLQRQREYQEKMEELANNRRRRGKAPSEKNAATEKTTSTVQSPQSNDRLQRLREHEERLDEIIQQRRGRGKTPAKSKPATVKTKKQQQKDNKVTVATSDGKILSVLAILSTQIDGTVTAQGSVANSRVSALIEDRPIQEALETICEKKGWFWYEDSWGNFTILDEETLSSRIDEKARATWKKTAYAHQIPHLPHVGSVADKDSPFVTVAASDGKFIRVLEVIEKQVSVTFTFKGTVTGEERVTILAESQPVEIVLDMICKPNNWAWWKVSDAEYAISDLEYYKSNK